MPINSSIYSIGHGQKTQEEFLAELKSFNIHFVVDVRTTPYSKWATQFNQGTIEIWLQQNRIRYIYLGDYIGGRPKNDFCYDEEGYFDYHKMAEEQSFQIGLHRLVDANSKNCRVAVMCSESDPSECHRSKLIGRELYFVHQISMNHIVAINKTIRQEEIMKTLTKGLWEPGGNLFGECKPPYFKSCKSYKNVTELSEETFIPYD